MKIIKEWNGCKLLEPDIYEDNRGHFYESFNFSWFNEHVQNFIPLQINESYSKYGVFRGMHFQDHPYAQAKIVKVVEGEVLDFALDLRKYGKYGDFKYVKLSKENKRQFYIPRGFAHGFLCKSEYCVLQYIVDNKYNKESEQCILYNSFGINPESFLEHGKVILSDKDISGAIPFDNFRSPF